jgi:hypothetical protein
MQSDQKFNQELTQSGRRLSERQEISLWKVVGK